MSNKPKTEDILIQIENAFTPLSKILSKFPENVFEHYPKPFSLAYDEELKEYRLTIDLEFLEIHLGEQDSN